MYSFYYDTGEDEGEPPPTIKFYYESSKWRIREYEYKYYNQSLLWGREVGAQEGGGGGEGVILSDSTASTAHDVSTI